MEAYRSLYGDLTKLKDASLLDNPAGGTGADRALFSLLLATSEAVDRHCNRHFYALTETRWFDGPGEAVLPLPDVIAVSSLRSDDDESGHYRTEWSRSEYRLLPLNASPEEHWGRPHNALRVRGNGPRQRFERGPARYEVRGRWGFGERLEYAGARLRSTTSETTTSLDVSSTVNLAVGQTIAAGAERMLVRALSTNRLTVTRGLNGTSPQQHALNATLSVVRWPAPVERAALINAARMWTRAPAFEPFYVDADLDTDVRLLLEPYRLGGVA
ncbi:MAG: hypothetical protein OXL97_03790 [Chloroflexota bacterium]|nr:hypothetical protein [Chloroflexota bacterium]MDE2886326.1 hypothetical protein [Chloroflexota bacterium]